MTDPPQETGNPGGGVPATPDVRTFLTACRARLAPAHDGLPDDRDRRRVPGLRREEVALLAGIGVDTYIRLERGNLAGVSHAVLDAVATALQLSDPERSVLHRMAEQAERASSPPRSRRPPRAHPQARWVLEGVHNAAAHVIDPNTEIVAATPLGRALFLPLQQEAGRPNLARFAFLNPGAFEYLVTWGEFATDVVVALRTTARKTPDHPGFRRLIAELTEASEHFRALWTRSTLAANSGPYRVRHPLVGPLTLTRESMDLRGRGGLRLEAYFPESGTPSSTAFERLERALAGGA